MKTLYKTIISVLPSIILVIIMYLLREHSSILSKSQKTLLLYAPYVVFAISAIIAWRFNRSRVFFMVLIFTLCYSTTYYLKDSFKSDDLRTIFSVVLPVNVLIFSFLKERGIASFWGLTRIGLILSEVLLLYYYHSKSYKELVQFVNKDIFPIDTKLHLPQLGIAAFLLTFTVLIIRLVLKGAKKEGNYIIILLVLLYVLHKNKIMDYSIFYTLIGIIFIISILQDTYFMAFFDELTSLPSRRALRQDMLKLGMKYSIAMLDIDFFKKFNDTYGHDTGDDVLKLVASIIKDVKGGGKAYRYGGEEFTILFPGKNINDVLSTLEDLREKIANKGFTVTKKSKTGTKRTTNNKRTKRNNKRKNYQVRNKNIRTRKVTITVSIGVATRDDTTKTPDAVLKSADTALYRAKKKGRNCVSK